jgi:hypothetical protein
MARNIGRKREKIYDLRILNCLSELMIILSTRLLAGIGAGLALFACSNVLYALPYDSTKFPRPTTAPMVLCPKVILNGITLGTADTPIDLSAGINPADCRTVSMSAVTVGAGAAGGAAVWNPNGFNTSSSVACNPDESMQQNTLNLVLPGGSVLGYSISLYCCKISLQARVSYEYTEVGNCPGGP